MNMTISKNKPLSYLLQAINYTVFMALIWYFASAPSIRVIDAGEAMFTIAFGHAGETIEPCRRMSQEELSKLPPNMRKPQECPRERSPIHIEVHLNGEQLFKKSLIAPGLYNDGSVNIYHSQKIPAGKHQVKIKMDDSVRKEGFDHTFEQDINIAPTKILLFAFDSQRGFIVK